MTRVRVPVATVLQTSSQKLHLQTLHNVRQNLGALPQTHKCKRARRFEKYSIFSYRVLRDNVLQNGAQFAWLFELERQLRVEGQTKRVQSTNGRPNQHSRQYLNSAAVVLFAGAVRQFLEKHGGEQHGLRANMEKHG